MMQCILDGREMKGLLMLLFSRVVLFARLILKNTFVLKALYYSDDDINK